MTRPNVTEVKVDTNETIVREMNDAEYEQYLIDVSSAEVTND